MSRTQTSIARVRTRARKLGLEVSKHGNKWYVFKPPPTPPPWDQDKCEEINGWDNLWSLSQVEKYLKYKEDQ